MNTCHIKNLSNRVNPNDTMARPKKTGLDYFSIDVDFYQNIKIRKIKMACGPQSISVLICLLCNIYRNKGYYIEWDKDLPFLIADEVGVTEGAATEIINKSVQVGFFNKELFEKGFITSKEIQERYEKACRDSKRTNVEIRKELDLIRFNSGNTPEETELIPEETTENQEKSTQSKVKESRVNKSKGKKNTSSNDDDRFYDIDFLKNEYKKNERLISAICENYLIDENFLFEKLDEFSKELKAKNRFQEKQSEYTSYFKNWLGVELKKQINQESNFVSNR